MLAKKALFTPEGSFCRLHRRLTRAKQRKTAEERYSCIPVSKEAVFRSRLDQADAPTMWPEKQKYPTDEEYFTSLNHNPEEAAARGKWTDLDFLKRVSELNSNLNTTQSADYHCHGWKPMIVAMMCFWFMVVLSFISKLMLCIFMIFV